MLKKGIYEKLINKKLKDSLEKSTDLEIKRSNIDKAESARTLSKYMATVLERSLKDVYSESSESEEDNSIKQVELINKVIHTIEFELGDSGYEEYQIDHPAEQLEYIDDLRNKSNQFEKNKEIIRPMTSISESSLFTGAKNEPQLYSELKKEIASSDRVDMLVSFIRWSGLRLILEQLKEFTDIGGRLRVITTSYMGATEVKCLEELRNLKNTEIKISYNTETTRLHAKTYVFHRENGFSTAYIGSSNISGPALTDGTEWNVKVTNQDLPYTISKISATFDQYWNMPEFETYNANDKERYSKAINKERVINKDELEFYFDIHPYQFQQEILDKLQAERELRNRYKNLVVAATGERVIIVMGAVCVIKPRVSGTLTKYISCIA